MAVLQLLPSLLPITFHGALEVPSVPALYTSAPHWLCEQDSVTSCSPIFKFSQQSHAASMGKYCETPIRPLSLACL